MAKVTRQVIKIDEDLCNGCGQCVSACAEGAIELIDGKAKLVSDSYCDGLGACIGECPVGAITFETREAETFDQEAVSARLKQIGREPVSHHHHGSPENVRHSAHKSGSTHICPSARTLVFEDGVEDASGCEGDAARVKSQLRQWPVKLILVNPAAPYFKDTELLVAADCTPFAYANIHTDFLKGKALVTGCPKFDDVELYRSKLTEILTSNEIKSVTVLRMEVPCCGGLTWLLKDAISASGKDIPLSEKIITLRGEVL